MTEVNCHKRAGWIHDQLENIQHIFVFPDIIQYVSAVISRTSSPVFH